MVPQLLWAKAYYSPATVNVGFDTFLEKTSFNEDNTQAEITFTYYGKNEKFALLAVMAEGKEYTATLDGKEVSFTNENGCLEFTLNSNFKDTHTIIIKEK